MYVTSLVRRLRKLVAAIKRLSLTSLPNPSQFTNESQTPCPGRPTSFLYMHIFKKKYVRICSRSEYVRAICRVDMH
jgi:hypothetical protein